MNVLYKYAILGQVNAVMSGKYGDRELVNAKMAPTVSDVQKEKQIKQLLKMASFLLRNNSAVSN